jgi:histidinol dehydrogenase
MDTLLERIDLRGASADVIASSVTSRVTAPTDRGPEGTVREIIELVRARGDAALRELTERFDGCRIDEIEVGKGALDAAVAGVGEALHRALELAAAQIRACHEALRPRGRGGSEEHASRGVAVRDETRAVDRAGCYVPGGLATYPSTVLMTVVPARLAGVGEVVLCVPPSADGSVPAATLAAARVAGADRVFRVGGAQAIAALAYGTETIPRVDVVVGPGNRFVTEAKRQVIGRVGIDSLAGPSEVVVVADDSVDARVVAADLIAQAEHGPGGRAVVVTWDDGVADKVEVEVRALLAGADRRDEATSTLRSGGSVVLVDGRDAAIEVVNAIAPEHLELLCEGADALVEHVRHAGAVFVGPWASAVVGDYVAGTNHVLPTGATARFASALGIDTFRKHMHVVTLDRDSLAALAPAVVALTEAEGLTAHRDAVLLRLGEDT